MNHTNHPTALQSQKWILKAMLILMQEMEYDKISVSEICRQAELDRRTFYRNFKSKNDVLEHYIEKLSNEYMTDFNNIDTSNKYATTLLFFKFWKRHLSFIKNMQNCGLSDFICKRFNEFSKSHKEFLIDVDKASAETDYMLAYRIGGFWNVMLR